MSDGTASALAEALRDRYLLDRELGRGGMATVYLARDLKHDRPVALKILHPDLAAVLGPERFLREIRLTASLQHPHILSVHDSGEAAGQLWYTMPYVEGESLRDRLHREKQLPIEDALQITRNVLAALAYAHSHGVIHRDIKPENILLEAGEAVVADFGIARAISAAGGEHLTQTGMSVGTPAYMSPEQAAGGSELEGRSDLYSVGCVLYEMLVGEPPYTGPTPQAVIAKRFVEPIPHVRTVRESVPEPVERAVTKALAKVPVDRFATASQFAEALTMAPTVSGPTVLGPSALLRGRPLLRRFMFPGALLLLAFAAGLVARGQHGRHRTSTGPKMLAVLPFENLGRPEDEYFADGLTEEITSRLASVHDLGVISRTSSMQYKKTIKPLKQIGRELGAGYLLEGSVRWEKLPDGRSRIRVTPQLIEVADDRHLWANRYDAELADVFEVQGNIAEQVTKALDVALAGPERRALVGRPTTNLDAYTFYLRGNEYAENGSREARPRAVAMYQRAVSLDPRFALAYAKLAVAHSRMYFNYDDPTPERLMKAKVAVDRAIELEPDLPEAHLALGYYYYFGSRDYDQALREFAIAQGRQASNSDLLLAVGSVQRRQGRWAPALANLKRAAELDPRSLAKLAAAGRTEWYLRDYAQAIRYFELCNALAPEDAECYADRALVYLAWDGHPERARAVLREAETKARHDELMYAFASVSFGAEFAALFSARTLDSLSRAPLAEYQGDTATYYVTKSVLCRFIDRPAGERVYADSLRLFWERRRKKRPEDPSPHAVLSYVYGTLGRRAEAVAESRRASALLPLSKDALWGPYVVVLAAGMYMRLDEPDSAVERLQYLLSIPSPMSSSLLRVDPFWDPLRSSRPFQRLVGTNR